MKGCDKNEKKKREKCETNLKRLYKNMKKYCKKIKHHEKYS